VPPVASVLEKKNKNTDPGAPRPSSTECSFIDDCYIVKEKVDMKDITFTSKTTGQQEVLKTRSPQMFNYKGDTYSWQNAGRNAYSVQKWAL
jgi:hypothetical protein